MADPLRRWFEVQRDLGGDELILDAPTDLQSAMAARRPVAVERPAAAAAAAAPAPPPIPVPAEPAVPVVTRLSGDPDAAWRKGAPPIPGGGLILAPPIRGTWASLEEIADAARGCTKCPLAAGRTQAVPGEGNPAARLMVVGEGPGESEDLSGRPFVGRAGELLDRILESIEAPRPSVYIANVVKCRPPKNRAPLPDEREACLPYLYRQIDLVRPKVLLALGSTAAEALLGVKRPLGEVRTRVHRWHGIPLIVTYHPAALLRNPNWKRPAWDDVRIARQLLDADA